MSSNQSNPLGQQRLSKTGDHAIPLRIYLLTVWREAGQASASWRFRLEDPQTRQQHGFADVQALMAMLEASLPAQNARVEDETTRDE